MNTKLTLRLDSALISQAKKEARKRGTSLSKMIAGYFQALGSSNKKNRSLPPETSALLGTLHGKKANREDYRQHLEDKYL